MLNGSWTNETLLDPGDTFTFDDGVRSFQFWALDDYGNNLSIPGGFVFDLQFKTDGLLTATVAATGVPELSSMFLFSLGICMVVLFGVARKWDMPRNQLGCTGLR